ncbi:CvpA family protein [Qipengyuania qiaonensis]|uniref:CvpA family protein n=1 Tax=Qipengyuania qiaonensis TaxID=2867240 RepID=A0ABS7J8G3_9SPHN|nr:CvpA family protein [Qipengyuania qiaonensis]MBX7481272.1 CvpA family protein [Qipengyuania qiaonensis]
MTGFDYIVLLIVGIAAAGGFMRGFMQEILSLAAWVLAVFAIRFLHTPLTLALQDYLGTDITTALLSFALLLLIPYAAMKVIANNVGTASRSSILGPIDRVLGFGFGALKGTVIVVIAFSLLVLGYDTVWSYKGRPNWITTARSYEFVDSSSRALVEMLAERRAHLRDQSSPSE